MLLHETGQAHTPCASVGYTSAFPCFPFFQENRTCEKIGHVVAYFSRKGSNAAELFRKAREPEVPILSQFGPTGSEPHAPSPCAGGSPAQEARSGKINPGRGSGRGSTQGMRLTPELACLGVQQARRECLAVGGQGMSRTGLLAHSGRCGIFPSRKGAKSRKGVGGSPQWVFPDTPKARMQEGASTGARCRVSRVGCRARACRLVECRVSRVSSAHVSSLVGGGGVASAPCRRGSVGFRLFARVFAGRDGLSRLFEAGFSRAP